MHARTYAQALLAALLAHPKDFSKLLQNLRKVLARRGVERLYGQVLRELLRLSELSFRRTGATVTLPVEKKLSKDVRARVEELGASPDSVQVIVDDGLIGGYQLRVGSHFVDASYRRQLVELFLKLKG